MRFAERFGTFFAVSVWHMQTLPMTHDSPNAMVRARLLERLGDLSVPRDAVILRAQLDAAADDIRNALVPLETIASLLASRLDDKSRSWCASTLREEVRHVLRILDELVP